MPIISLEFVLFTLIVLGLYYLLPTRPQNYLLLAASYGFLALWAWQFALVAFCLTLFNYFLGLRLSADKRRLLWLGIGGNIAALIFFKQADFFIGNLINFLGLSEAGALGFLLPLGISFYTLQNIAYLFDVQSGASPKIKNWLHFSLYISYFPKIISGPIERPKAFIEQISAPRRVDNPLMAESLSLIFVGVMRKILLADVLLTLIPSEAFSQPSGFSSGALLVYLLAYAFALYNDFAGYSNMVRGVSGLFGIRLSQNFNLPYLASSFGEFWNRWHISLSHWLRDYSYMPLVRALLRRRYPRQHLYSILIPPLVTMLISGLWHGLGAHFLLWGALHGLYQALERYITLQRPTTRYIPQWRRVLSTGLVFTAVVLAWIPFRMELPIAAEFLRALLSSPQLNTVLLIPLSIIGLSCLLDYAQLRWGEIFFHSWRAWPQAAFIALVLLALFLVTRLDVSPPFIYQGF